MAITAQQAREAAVALAKAETALLTMSKVDLTAAVNAVDTWCDDNQASFVAALPQPFRGVSTTSQKGLILALVVMRRASVVSVP